MTDLFLDTATRIGRRLSATARWNADVCTWMVSTSGDWDGVSPQSPDAAGGGVYRGTAGIALFLAALYRATGGAEFARTAAGAARHALDDTPNPRPQFGFHGGRVGVAFAAAQVGRAVGDASLLAAAADHLAPLAGHEDESSIDVVAGAAGAIAPLLHLARILERPALHAMAARLAESLIQRAERGPAGWSWGDDQQTSDARHLCGMAHGAAGMGCGLLEMHAATGDRRFAYGAEQAFVYERQFFDPERGNWMDLRHSGVTRHLQRRDLDALRDEVRRNGLIPFTPRWMSAWCYGAPGIALTRLRALQLLGSDVYRQESDAALAEAVRSLDDMDNASLCHGALGNAEPLLWGADILGRPELRARAEAEGAMWAERIEAGGRPWPCGTPGRVPDPGFMLGEAGIGHFYLRLHDSATPPLLLVTAPEPAVRADPATHGAAMALAREDAAAFFARSLRVLAAEGADPLTGMLDADPRPPAALARQAVAARIAAERDEERRERLEDAVRVEVERYEMTLSIDDFTAEMQRSLLPAPAAPEDGDGTRYRLADDTRVVRTDWAWDEVESAAGGVLRVDDAAPRTAFHLLLRASNRVQARSMGVLAGLVLTEAQREPATAEEIAERVAAQGLAAEPEALLRGVREQLRSAVRAGLVTGSAATVPA